MTEKNRSAMSEKERETHLGVAVVEIVVTKLLSVWLTLGWPQIHQLSI